MIYEKIGDLSDYRKIGNISTNIEDNILVNALVAVEAAYLRKWLGDSAYKEVLTYPTDIQQRISNVLAVLAEGYLIANMNNITRFGAVKKITEEAEPLTSGEKKSASSELRLQAINEMKLIEQEVTTQGYSCYAWGKEVNLLKLTFIR